MKFIFILLDGFDLLSLVQDLKTTFAELVRVEVDNKNIEKERYTTTLKFKKILNGCWDLEWFSIPTDPVDTKRFRISWKYAYELDDKLAEQFPEGKESRKYVAEYIVKWIIDEPEKTESVAEVVKTEDLTSEKKEEEITETSTDVQVVQ